MVKHFGDLEVYQGGMSLVMRVSAWSKEFPPDERFALTDQIRRSCRSICANIAEAWRKRRYKAAFISKLNDAETEASETQVHLDIALHHNYVDRETFEAVDDAFREDRAVLEAQHRNLKERAADSLVNIVHDAGPEKMLRLLDRLLAKRPPKRRRCPRLAHDCAPSA